MTMPGMMVNPLRDSTLLAAPPVRVRSAEVPTPVMRSFEICTNPFSMIPSGPQVITRASFRITRVKTSHMFVIENYVSKESQEKKLLKYPIARSEKCTTISMAEKGQAAYI